MQNVPRIDCHTHVGVDPVFYAKGWYPYAQDYRGLVAEARRNGIDRLITFPFVAYLGWEGVTLSGAGVDASTPYAFENRRMLEEIYDLNPDLASVALPFAIVDPARRQPEQVKALRDLRSTHRIFGLKIQATMIRSPIRDLLGPGRGLLDLAADWNVPLLIHSSIDPADVWSQAADILDIAEARPDVRFCLAHSCRFHLPSLERLLSLGNAWVDCSAHGIHCQAARDGLPIVAREEERLPADYSRPDAVLAALYERLPDRLMWGSDAPFHSYAATHDGVTVRLFSTYERETAALGLLTAEARQAVLHDNILRFLGVSHV